MLERSSTSISPLPDLVGTLTLVLQSSKHAGMRGTTSTPVSVKWPSRGQSPQKIPMSSFPFGSGSFPLPGEQVQG